MQTLKNQIRMSINCWREMMSSGDISRLDEITHPDAIFRSPTAHKPYKGALALGLALKNVSQVFENHRYHRELFSEDGLDVMLEFSASVQGKDLKGTELIRFNEAGKITDFEVMVRPLNSLFLLDLAMGHRVGTELDKHRELPT